jgi:arginine/ornithine transport system permease protein
MLSDYIATVLGAGWISLQLAFLSLVLAVVLGLLGALGKRSGNRVIRIVVEVYTTVIRGVPDLVVMLLVFYSLPAMLNQGFESLGWDYNVEFSPFAAGCITLGLIFGAFMTETFRGALQNIPIGQVEAARAYGLSHIRTFYAILLPQMIRLALPGFTNNWLVLFKATALVSLLGLQDIMFRARGAAEATAKPFTFYLLAGGFYLGVTIASLVVLIWVKRRYSTGARELSR